MTSRVVQVDMDNFRCFEGDFFNFFSEIPLGDGACNGVASLPYDLVRISGRNGVGKTTLREALIFALTGRDSLGRVNPHHLIKRGSESLRVTLNLTGTTLTRTLTQKGNGSVKLSTLPGKYLTQAQFRAHMCYDEELALCALLPGFFMKQTPEKRRKLITKAFPKTLRKTLAAEYTMIDLDWLTQKFGNLEEGLPSAALVSKERMRLYKLLVRTEEYVKKLEEDINREIEDVVLDPEIEKIKEDIFKEKEAIQAHQNKLQSYFEQKAMYDSLVRNKESWVRMQQALTHELHAIVDKKEPHLDWSGYEELKNAIKPNPPDIIFSKALPVADVCPSCGQVVGLEHRKKVNEDFEREKAVWMEETRAVEEHNSVIREKLDTLYLELSERQNERNRVIAENMANATRRASITKQLFELSVPQLPEAPSMPEAPARKFDEEDFKKNNAIIEWHFRRVGVVEHYKVAKNTALVAINTARQELEEVREECDRYGRIENLIKDFPKIEYRARRGLLEIPLKGLSLVESEEGVEFTYKLVPYELLSTGEKMIVDLAISKKFHEICALIEHCKLPRVIFMDNADLIDWSYESMDKDFQMFVAFVNQGDMKIEGFYADATTSQSDTPQPEQLF